MFHVETFTKLMKDCGKKNLMYMQQKTADLRARSAVINTCIKNYLLTFCKY